MHVYNICMILWVSVCILEYQRLWYSIPIALIYSSRNVIGNWNWCIFENRLHCFWTYSSNLQCSYGNKSSRQTALKLCFYLQRHHGPLKRYATLRVAHAPGMRMHHGTCVTHVRWCMSGSLTRGGGENVPGIPGACATGNFTYLVRDALPLTYVIAL